MINRTRSVFDFFTGYLFVKPVQVEADDTGDTPLHTAIRTCTSAIVFEPFFNLLIPRTTANPEPANTPKIEPQ